MSVPHAKRNVTREIPSRDTLSTRSTPGTELTLCSIRSVRNRSTSRGATSGYLVYTTSRGYEMSGSRSIGSRWKEIDPKRATATKNIVTATGRLIELLESDIARPYCDRGRGIRWPTC